MFYGTEEKKNAFVLVHFGDNPKYFELELYFCMMLRKYTKHDIVYLYSEEDTPSSFVHEITPFVNKTSSYSNNLTSNPEFSSKYTSFNTLRTCNFIFAHTLTEYDKICIVESDLVIMGDMDGVFDLPSPAILCYDAPPSKYNSSDKHTVSKSQIINTCVSKSRVNGGVMVFQPDDKLLAKYKEAIPIIAAAGCKYPNEALFEYVNETYYNLPVRYNLSHFHTLRLDTYNMKPEDVIVYHFNESTHKPLETVKEGWLQANLVYPDIAAKYRVKKIPIFKFKKEVYIPNKDKVNQIMGRIGDTTNTTTAKVNNSPTINPALSQVKIAIIVPFRDSDASKSRTKQLHEFVKYMQQYLAGMNYEIVLIEQTEDDQKFNRGKLLNIGFVEARKRKADIFVFHDVDLLPSPELQQYYITIPTQPTHIAAVWGRYGKNPKYFGGITAFSGDMYERVNGYPNDFWGWGGEDDELYLRTKEMYEITKVTKGSIRDLENLTVDAKMDYLRKNDLKFMQKYEALEKHDDTWQENGLSNLDYVKVSEKVTPIVWILARLDPNVGAEKDAELKTAFEERVRVFKSELTPIVSVWEEHMSKKYNRVYWYNRETKKSVWVKPSELKDAPVIEDVTPLGAEGAVDLQSDKEIETVDVTNNPEQGIPMDEYHGIENSDDMMESDSQMDTAETGEIVNAENRYTEMVNVSEPDSTVSEEEMTQTYPVSLPSSEEVFVSEKPKCKRGTRRNNMTGLCESNKCKRGTRRNKTSGKCEPSEKPSLKKELLAPLIQLIAQDTEADAKDSKADKKKKREGSIPKKMDTTEMVVARYNEDLSWLSDVSDDIKIIVYNKGQPDVAQYPIITLPNIGRESHTYLHHIITNYDNLADVTIFCQGDSLFHSPGFIHLLNNRDKFEAVQPLSAYYWPEGEAPYLVANPPIPVQEQMNHLWIDGNRVHVEYVNHDFVTVYPLTYYQNHFLKLVDLIKRIYDVDNVMSFFGEKLGIDTLDTSVLFPISYAGLFAVRREVIHEKPVEFYQNIQDMLINNVPLDTNGKPVDFGLFLEKLWMVIFNYKKHSKYYVSLMEKEYPIFTKPVVLKTDSSGYYYVSIKNMACEAFLDIYMDNIRVSFSISRSRVLLKQGNRKLMVKQLKGADYKKYWCEYDMRIKLENNTLYIKVNGTEFVQYKFNKPLTPITQLELLYLSKYDVVQN